MAAHRKAEEYQELAELYRQLARKAKVTSSPWQFFEVRGKDNKWYECNENNSGFKIGKSYRIKHEF